MKEILAGIAAAEVDKLVETKGLDWLDARKVVQRFCLTYIPSYSYCPP